MSKAKNSTVEFVKIRAPKHYTAQHLWAVMDEGQQYGEIVPDYDYDAKQRRVLVGYTVYAADGTEYYSMSNSNRLHMRTTVAHTLQACKSAARNMVCLAKEDAAAKAG